jgi:hypothetical protein
MQRVGAWPFAEGMIHWVQVMDGLGQREKARETLAQYDWLAAYTGGAEMLGRTWLQLGDGARSRGFYQMAWKLDALALSSSEIGGDGAGAFGGGAVRRRHGFFCVGRLRIRAAGNMGRC